MLYFGRNLLARPQACSEVVEILRDVSDDYMKTFKNSFDQYDPLRLVHM